MKAHHYIILQLAIVTGILLTFAGLNILVDPLFQYHRPWFGFKPLIKDKRYQNAGIARNFDFDYAVVGNSLAENIWQNDLDLAMGGNTVRLTAPGSHPLDWRLVLGVLKNRRIHPKKLLLNMDPYIFDASTTQLKHSWPLYLYDQNPFNDVNYLLNFDITWDFTRNVLKKNTRQTFSSFEKLYVWNDFYGREKILRNVSRVRISDTDIDDDKYVHNALENIKLLTDFFQEMPETEFIFFCSPFSVLFWDKCIRNKSFDACKRSYYAIFECLLKYSNVRIYFWNDDELLQWICDLDYYRDEAHFDTRVGRGICERISRKEGLMTAGNYKAELNRFFVFLTSYQYDNIWEEVKEKPINKTIP